MNDIVATRVGFLEELRIQRWDDHRYYHQSRVNQSLHLLSALCFLTTYVVFPVYPIVAAVLGWVVAMWVRQIGHFWFEPKGFDTINNTTFEHKEAIKVGFNLERKVVLLAAWLLIPVFVAVAPTGGMAYLDRLGWAWILLAWGGLCARTIFLMVTRGFQTGAVWFTKILTDPFNDVVTYWRAPYHLLRGQWLDPMDHVRH